MIPRRLLVRSCTCCTGKHWRVLVVLACGSLSSAVLRGASATPGQGWVPDALGEFTERPDEFVAGRRSIEAAYTGTASCQSYFRSDPAVVPLTAGRTYRVTFRYKILTAARYDRQPWVRYVDIGSIGNWGEGHAWAGRRKSLSFAVRKLHVDLHRRYFKRAPLVLSDDYVDALPDLGEREHLDRPILASGISYRDDSIMVNGYFSGTSDRFTVRSPEYFAEAYRHTPTVFELEHYGKVKQLGNWDVRPDSPAAKFGRGKTGPDFFRGALELLHATSIGYHGDARAWLDDNLALTRELLNRCGYWLFPLSLDLPSTLVAGTASPLRVTFENRGVAPSYQPDALRVKLSAEESRWVGVVGRADPSWPPGAPIVVQNQLIVPADFKPGRTAVRLGLFDRSSGKERPVELALRADLRDADGYHRVAEIAMTSSPQPKRCALTIL